MRADPFRHALQAPERPIQPDDILLGPSVCSVTVNCCKVPLPQPVMFAPEEATVYGDSTLHKCTQILEVLP